MHSFLQNLIFFFSYTKLKKKCKLEIRKIEEKKLE